MERSENTNFDGAGLAQAASNTVHIWPEEPVIEEGTITISAAIELAGDDRRRLWYRLSEEMADRLAPNCDPFVIGTIFLLMEQGHDVIVHGEVSPSLLRNMQEFQEAWSCWRKEKYKQVEITADKEREPQGAPRDSAVAAFTGGVDSTFTMYRHKTGKCGRLKRNIAAGLLVHGFDIPLVQEEAFRRASRRAGEALSTLDVELITMASNHMELNPDWNYTHISGIASGLSLLQGGYKEGLIANSLSYNQLSFQWGSNAVTDRLFGSDNFAIVLDGLQFARRDKIPTVAQWEKGMENLRVCFEADEKDKNCGKCSKCMITLLCLRRWGVPLPPSFPGDVSDADIMNCLAVDESHLFAYSEVLAWLKTSGMSGSWVDALDEAVKLNQLKFQQKEPQRVTSSPLSSLAKKLLGIIRSK